MLHESLVKESILFKPEEDAEKAPQGVVSEEVTRGVVQDEEYPGSSTDFDNRTRAIGSEVKLSYTTFANLSAAEVSKYQKDDPDIGPILKAKLSDKKPTN